jgi:O-antigen ligase
VGAIAAATVGIALAAAIGGLPMIPAIALGVGLPALVVAVASPRIALVMLIFSIPLSSWATLSAGSFSITPTDVLVAIIVGGWLVRGILQGRLVVHGGPMIGALLLVAGTALLSTLTATDFADALKELIKLAEMITIALYASSVLHDESDLRFPMIALLAAGAMEALFGLRQFATRSGPEFFELGPFMRAYGDFGQPNALAGYLGMILPFGVVLSLQPSRHRRVFVALTAVVAVGIAATWSRGAWIGTLGGLSVMALVWSNQTRRWLAIGAGAVALLAVLGLGGLLPTTLAERFTVLFENFVVFDVNTVDATPTNWALVERMAHWQAGWAMALDHPLVGVGPGNYEAVYPRYYLGDWLEPLGHAHNYYINTFAETGIIGLVAFLGFLATMFVRLVSAIRQPGMDGTTQRAVLVAVLGAALTLTIHNTFDNIFVHGIEVQFGLMLGLAEAAVRSAAPRSVAPGA